MVFASESCALDAVGARFERDIRPGEIVVVDRSGVKSDTRHCNKVPKRLCVFEFIYFARPDSVIDGSSVHVARQRAGAFLALEHPVQADIVVGVPDSGLDAALGYARQSGIPYGMGFIKKQVYRPYLHLPHPVHAGKRGQHQAQPHPLRGGGQARGADRRLHRKRNPAFGNGFLPLDNGAKEIHVRSACPPIMYGCKYLNFSRSVSDLELITRRVIRDLEGIEGEEIDAEILKEYADSNTQKHEDMVEEIRKRLQFDSLKFQNLEDTIEAIGVDKCKLCTYCWDGKE